MIRINSDQLKWEKKGECNNCGYCCINNGSTVMLVKPAPPLKQFDDSDTRFWRLRGIENVEEKRAGFAVWIGQYIPCSAYDSLNKRCTIYEERPRTCREFPKEPGQVIATPCSYWFEAVDRFGTVWRIGGLGSPHPYDPNDALPQGSKLNRLLGDL